MKDRAGRSPHLCHRSLRAAKSAMASSSSWTCCSIDRLVGLAATAEGRFRALALADRAEQRTSAGCLGGSAAFQDRGQVSRGHRRVCPAAVSGSGGKMVCDIAQSRRARLGVAASD